MNIHPGEDWQSVLDAVKTYAPAVRARLKHDGPFGLGLRLSAEAAATLEQGDNVPAFRDHLADHGLYAFTINGFPYGQFHGTRVKEHVYEPDWSTAERLDYTRRLVRILTALLPEDVPGSISTLPGTYGRNIPAEARAAILRNLLDAGTYCAEVSEGNGRECRLAIEPEPGCLWESTEDLVRLFAVDLPRESKTTGAANATVRRGLGVCLDTCHMAVLYEDIPEAMRRLTEHEIPIAKIQLSAGLICPNDAEALKQLESFDEPVYLHQCAVRSVQSMLRFADLHNALSAVAELDEWNEMRTHFHVPLFADRYGALRSTGTLLGSEFFDLVKSATCRNLEVETYSFQALPEQHRSDNVIENVAKELGWVLGQLESTKATKPPG